VDLAEPVTRLAAGERHTLALDRTGSIWAWGQNLHGELGMAASAERLSPVRVLGGLAPSMIVAGAYHNLALDISGALYAWGSGFRGQLGNGTLFDSATPLLVPIPRNVTGISGGRFHSLVVQEGGGVFAFGDNTECQIATWPTLDNVALPSPVTAVGPALAAVAGDYHSVVLDYSGGVSGWGNDSAGQLGRADGTLPHYDCVPAPVGDEPANIVGAGAARSFVGVRAASDVTPAAP
jgi:alpha-tubulin suppressor-like RCC1 family protein